MMYMHTLTGEDHLSPNPRLRNHSPGELPKIVHEYTLTTYALLGSPAPYLYLSDSPGSSRV